MLLPKKLGMEATSKNLNDLKLKKAHEDKVAAEVLADAQALAAQIEKESITLSIKMGETEEPLVPFLPRKLQRQSSRSLDMTSTKEDCYEGCHQGTGHTYGWNQAAYKGNRRSYRED